MYLPYKVPSQVLGMAYLTWFLECLKESFHHKLDTCYKAVYQIPFNYRHSQPA
nr:MAG TPA_asm: hypothetical protein [Caudoviricetes sp.]